MSDHSGSLAFPFHKRVTGEDGTDSIHALMKTAFGDSPEIDKIADGSGVSVDNYISPRLLFEYLKYA
jgi:D-alanyl-D-alanine carboxypeptidase (penicillin-binding protein 4)